MTKKEVETRIELLKMDYVRIQNDMEKLESVGQRTTKAEQQLIKIEDELRSLRKQLKELE